ncbi:MAG: ATP-binding cassette domain-containing protein [Pyrinomonadaceae bacterium]
MAIPKDMPERAAENPPETVVSVKGLRKAYGGFEAVGGVDLEIRRGEIYGLIGPDGAGKTSTFQILGGVMARTSGEVQMYGTDPRKARAFVGYLTQAFSLYLDLTVLENLAYVGELRLIPKHEIRERGMHYLKLFDMDRFSNRLAGRLSGGMKQKLALACALIARPKILLLDEPTTGVDPVSRREFWDTLAALSGEGMTMLVATPYLDEAERCTRVSLMFDGKIVDSGTPTELRERSGLKRLELRSDELGLAESALEIEQQIHDVQRFGDRLDVMVEDEETGANTVKQRLLEEGVSIKDLRARRPTLENAFVLQLRDLIHEEKPAPFPRKRAFAKRAPGGVAIGAENLTKVFGDFVAVRNIDLDIKYGEIYGLLGANGAGKTTTIKMLCGLLDSTSGVVELAGERESVKSSGVRRRIGYMSQKFSLYDNLTIGENLEFFAGVYGVPRSDLEEKKRWVLEFSGLGGRENLMTGDLPGGWKQRVAFGSAILHEPSVLFLDEPTSGVDPLARRSFWKMINELADRGVAVLVTTHYLEEAEQCNRLGFMVAGEVVAGGTPSSVKAAQQGNLIELIVSDPQNASNILKREMDGWRVSLFGDRLHVIVESGVEEGISSVSRSLRRVGIEVFAAYEETRSLEDVFIEVVEKQNRKRSVTV